MRLKSPRKSNHNIMLSRSLEVRQDIAQPEAPAAVVVVSGTVPSPGDPTRQRKMQLKSRDSTSISYFRVDVLALLGTAAGLFVRTPACVGEWETEIFSLNDSTTRANPLAEEKTSTSYKID